MATKISFLGAGKMASALISCIHKNSSYKIIAARRNKEALDKIKKQFRIAATTNNIEAVKNADIIFICVKPRDINQVISEIKDDVKNQLIVSIVAGIKIETIENKLENARVMRVMPNVPCLVGEMAAGIAAGKNAAQSDINMVKKILNSAGKSYLVEEKLMDAVTALSGSGPAFFAYLIEALAEAAVKNGLPRKIAGELAAQTALGTAKLLLDKKMESKELINMVASKGGTTEAGLRVLYNSDIKEVLEKSINAAVKRSRELAR